MACGTCCLSVTAFISPPASPMKLTASSASSPKIELYWLQLLRCSRGPAGRAGLLRIPQLTLRTGKRLQKSAHIFQTRLDALARLDSVRPSRMQHQFLRDLLLIVAFCIGGSVAHACDLCGCYTPQMEAMPQSELSPFGQTAPADASHA